MGKKSKAKPFNRSGAIGLEVASDHDRDPPKMRGEEMINAKTGKTRWRHGSGLPAIPDLINLSIPGPCTHADVVRRIAGECKWRIDSLPAQLLQPACPRGRT